MTARGSDPPAGGQPKASGTTRPEGRVSIALCTDNGARFLDAQLGSSLTQTRLPDELVVCDDGSADGTPGGRLRR